MKHLFLKTTVLLFLTTIISCEGNNINTNDSTGNDTFSFYINGQLYIPSAGTGINGGDIRPFYWSYKEGDSNITIQGGGDYTFFINLINPKEGDNFLNEELRNTLDYGSSGMVVHNALIFYNTRDNQNNGYVYFTELTETKAVGTFDCVLYNDNGDELKVTNGKFNLSLDSRTN